MCLVLETDEPLFCLVLKLHRNHDGTGIDLVALFHVVEDAVPFQLLHAEDRQIHEADELIVTACVDLLSVILIFFKCLLKQLFVRAVLERNVL